MSKKNKNISTKEKMLLMVLINITKNIWAYVVGIFVILGILTDKLNNIIVISDLLKHILSSNVVLAVSMTLNIVLLIAVTLVFREYRKTLNELIERKK